MSLEKKVPLPRGAGVGIAVGCRKEGLGLRFFLPCSSDEQPLLARVVSCVVSHAVSVIPGRLGPHRGRTVAHSISMAHPSSPIPKNKRPPPPPPAPKKKHSKLTNDQAMCTQKTFRQLMQIRLLSNYLYQLKFRSLNLIYQILNPQTESFSWHSSG